MQYSVTTKVHMGWNTSWSFTAPIGPTSLKSQCCAYAQSQWGNKDEASWREDQFFSGSHLNVSIQAHVSCPPPPPTTWKYKSLNQGEGGGVWGGCLPSRLGKENEKLHQAFSEANLWLSGQHGLLPMTIWFLHQQVTEIRWGQRECVYQPNRTRLSSLSTVSFPFGWRLPVLSLGGWCGSNPLKKQNSDVLKGSCRPLLAGSCGASWTVRGFCKARRQNDCVTCRVFTKG